MVTVDDAIPGPGNDQTSSVGAADDSAATTRRRNRYLAVLAPLIGALVVLTMATLSMNRPDEVTEWTMDTFFPHQWFGHRQLHHPSGNVAKYLACTRMLDESDHDFDNALTVDEFKVFMNDYSDEHYKQQVGEDLPQEMREIFNKYAKATEGKNSQIIDIYGSGNGERDGITEHQEDLLEGLCNATDVTLYKMFGKEHKTLGVKITDVGEVREIPGQGNNPKQTIAVNASFTMTLPEGMTVQDLIDSLTSGEDPGHLRHAFQSFVMGVIGHLGGVIDEGGDDEGGSDVDNDVDGNMTRRFLESLGGGIRGAPTAAPTDAVEAVISFAFDVIEEESYTARARFRRLNLDFDPNSAEIYNYVESLCPGQNASSIVDSIKGLLTGNTTNETAVNQAVEKKCVTAMGKYKVEVDQAEIDSEGGVENIYQAASDATNEAIDNGELEAELEKEPDGNMFHIEGEGMVEDDSFDPYAELGGAEEDKSMRTVDIILISVGSAIIFCLCCVLCFVELERKTRPRPARG